MICAQTRVPGVSVSQVARRYDVNANLVFTWRRDPRFSGEPSSEAPARFLPVEVIKAVPPKPCPSASPSTSAPSSPPSSGEGLIELDLASGHRLRISGSYDPDALARLIRALSA